MYYCLKYASRPIIYLIETQNILFVMLYTSFYSTNFIQIDKTPFSLVRYVILAISVAKIDFIVFTASLWVK